MAFARYGNRILLIKNNAAAGLGQRLRCFWMVGVVGTPHVAARYDARPALKLEGNCATHYKTECAGKIRRYLTVAESNGISFHRFYVGIQSVSLKPAITGFGYKAVFAGDEKVQAMLENAQVPNGWEISALRNWTE